MNQKQQILQTNSHVLIIGAALDVSDRLKLSGCE